MKDKSPDGLKLKKEDCKSLEGDDVWHFLGRFGKFQLFQFFIFFLIGTCLAPPVLSGLFTGVDVEAECVTSNNSLLARDNVSLVVKSCGFDVVDNVTSRIIKEETCSQFSFGEKGKSSYKAEWNLVCSDEALGQLPQMLTMVGMGIGALTLPVVGDKFGRKKLVLGSLLVLLVVSLAMAFVEQLGVFIFLKFLSGFCQQGIMVPWAVLMIEILPTELRHLGGFMNPCLWCLSWFLVGIIGYVLRESHWRKKQMVFALVSSSVVIAFIFLHESLRWLLGNSKVKEAEKVMKKACKLNNKDYQALLKTVLNRKKGKTEDDHQELLSPLDKPESGINTDNTQTIPSYHLLSLLKDKQMVKISLIMCFTWMMCSLTYYGLILLSTSMAGDPHINFMLAGLMEFLSTFLMTFCINRFGRKRTILVFQIVAGASLFSTVLTANFAPQTHGFSLLRTFLSLNGLFFVAGSFNLCWIFTPELYPTNYRNFGIGISSFSARMGAVSSPFFSMLARKALWAPGALFSTGCFLSAFLLTLVPETKGRELPKALSDVQFWISEDRKNKSTEEGMSKETTNLPLEDVVC